MMMIMIIIMIMVIIIIIIITIVIIIIIIIIITIVIIIIIIITIMIDKMVIQDCHRGKRNLSMDWVDVKNEYPLIKWPNEIMELHRLPS